jgi:predicted ATP-dependent serine protease
LDVADLRTFEDINREVPQESYNFIFIDSLDNMKIDADKMKKIRERYKNSALITISQSTKDGKMRGSYEIVHDCDIAVKVEMGVASTTKNRFKEKGMTLNVFEEKNSGNVLTKRVLQLRGNDGLDSIM